MEVMCALGRDVTLGTGVRAGRELIMQLPPRPSSTTYRASLPSSLASPQACHHHLWGHLLP